MTEFDPKKHLLVGVIPDTGEHVHVNAPNVEASVSARVESLEQQVESLTASLADAATSQSQLLDICRALDERISSLSVQKQEAA